MRLSDSVKILPVWGKVIPGNTGDPKKNVMPVDESLTMEDIFKSIPVSGIKVVTNWEI